MTNRHRKTLLEKVADDASFRRDDVQAWIECDCSTEEDGMEALAEHLSETETTDVPDAEAAAALADIDGFEAAAEVFAGLDVIVAAAAERRGEITEFLSSLSDFKDAGQDWVDAADLDDADERRGGWEAFVEAGERLREARAALTDHGVDPALTYV